MRSRDGAVQRRERSGVNARRVCKIVEATRVCVVKKLVLDNDQSNVVANISLRKSIQAHLVFSIQMWGKTPRG